MPSKQQTNQQAEFIIHAMSQECRGISKWGSVVDHEKTDAAKLGKKVFIKNALPNERVKAVITHEKKQLIEAIATDVIGSPSAYRTSPPCRHFDECGGCQLQYIEPEAQLTFKQTAFNSYLTKTLARHYQPVEAQELPKSNEPLQVKQEHPTWLPAITSDAKRYRRKVRLGVRYIGDELIIGFRQPKTNRLIQIDDCTVLHPAINNQLKLIHTTLSAMSNHQRITHLEIAVGDDKDGDSSVVMLIRHTSAFIKTDLEQLINVFTPINWQLLSQAEKGAVPIQIDWLYENILTNKSNQPKNQNTNQKNNVHKVERLQSYYLNSNNLKNTDSGAKNYEVAIDFSVQDFIQVNANVNQAMVNQVIELLDLKPDTTVLDLFSGVGNFSLPIAKSLNNTGLVIGIEGSDKMSKRARNNAQKNGLTNCVFFSQNLASQKAHADIKNKFQKQTGKALPNIDAVVIDPPRSGAKEILPSIKQLQVKTVVYISCNVATFVRDAIELTKQGYWLSHVGVMDMFPHTEHLEVMAKFSLQTS